MRLSPAVISASLAALEDRLGVTLLERTTRTMRLTDAGASVLDHARTAMTAADDALALGLEAAERPSGLVKLSAPTELCQAWAPPLLARFQEAFPDARVSLDANDTLAPLAGTDIDLAVSASFAWRRPTRVAEDQVAVIPLALVAGPEADLSGGFKERVERIGFIATQAPDGGKAPVEARTEDGKLIRAQAPCRTVVNDRMAILALARDGLGAALALRFSVENDLASGRLVEVAPDHTFGVAIARIRARDRRPTAVARALRRFLLQEAGGAC